MTVQRWSTRYTSGDIERPQSEPDPAAVVAEALTAVQRALTAVTGAYPLPGRRLPAIATVAHGTARMAVGEYTEQRPVGEYPQVLRPGPTGWVPRSTVDADYRQDGVLDQNAPDPPMFVETLRRARRQHRNPYPPPTPADTGLGGLLADYDTAVAGLLSDLDVWAVALFADFDTLARGMRTGRPS